MAFKPVMNFSAAMNTHNTAIAALSRKPNDGSAMLKVLNCIGIMIGERYCCLRD